MHRTANWEDIEPGTMDCGRIDIGRVHLHIRDQGRHRGAYGSRAAAQVNNNWRGGWPPLLHDSAEECRSLSDQQFRPAARHENARLHPDPEPAKFCPAENVLERKPVDPPLHGVAQLFGTEASGEEEVRLVLGKDTAGGAEEAGDGGSGKR
jgi:hypothetical protein